MTDTVEHTYHRAYVAGHEVGVTAPTRGQFEAMLRMRNTLLRGTDDERHEFYVKQLDRIGTLLESLIAESDRDLVDTLVLTGKVDLVSLMGAVFEALKPIEEAAPAKAAPVKKAVKARVPRAGRN